MSIFGKRPDKALVNELEAHAGRRIAVIAHGSGPEATLLATRDMLALRTLDRWRTFGWEQIAHGAWRADDSTFLLKTTTGEEMALHLDDAGRLPELLRERVQASTAVSVSHDLSPRGRVEIIGRRRLDGDDGLTWYAVAGGGANLDDPAVAAFVVEETDRLKAEYES